MYLTAYHFRGDREPLLAASDRLLAAYPPSSLPIVLCVVRSDGVTILDACPSEEVAAAFSSSSEFAASLSAVGLPEPVVEHLGDIHRIVVDEIAGVRAPTSTT